MKKIHRTLVFLATGILMAGVFTTTVVSADGDERGGKRGGKVMAPADNALYKQECGSCHFLFLPGLLPSRSWQAVMKGSSKHFGENLGLDEQTSKELGAYLTANAADKVDNRRSRKMASSIADSAAPIRITEVPYIVKEHREIGKEVFKRPSIGSFSNCGACHTKGAQGDFEEDSVVIPRK